MAGYRLAIASGCAMLLLVCTSCNKDGRIPVYPVEGQVLFQGKPTPNAMISLHPLQKHEPDNVHPLGYADQEGKFSLTTYETNDGAPAGDYEVSIIWFKQVEERTAEQPNLLPAKYADPKTSGLRVTVKEGTNTLKPFELTK
jgi:hypothetical protein